MLGAYSQLILTNASNFVSSANSVEDLDSDCGRESTPVKHENEEENEEQNKDDTLPLLYDEEYDFILQSYILYTDWEMFINSVT